MFVFLGVIFLVLMVLIPWLISETIGLHQPSQFIVISLVFLFFALVCFEIAAWQKAVILFG